MGDLVDDMLLLARLDQARPLDRRLVDLLSIATDAVIDAEARQPERPISLHPEPSDLPPVVLGDEARLRQVIANLVSNALAHTPKTSAIDVAVGVEKGAVWVAVSDAGPGIGHGRGRQGLRPVLPGRPWADPTARRNGSGPGDRRVAD